MVDRKRLLRELRFVGDNLGGRTETLDEIGQEYATAYKILSDDSGRDLLRVNKKRRLEVMPYGNVWNTIDEMKGNKGLTGSEIARRLIKKHQPYLHSIPGGSLAFDMFHITRYGS